MSERRKTPPGLWSKCANCKKKNKPLIHKRANPQYQYVCSCGRRSKLWNTQLSAVLDFEGIQLTRKEE